MSDARGFETSLGTILGRVDGAVVRARGIPYARAGRFEVPEQIGLPVGSDGDPVPFRAFERAPASPQRSSRVLEAVLEGASAGIKTSDLGGSSSTTEVTDDVINRVKTKIDVWASLGSH